MQFVFGKNSFQSVICNFLPECVSPLASANLFPDQTHKPTAIQQQIQRHKGAMTG